MNRWPLLLLILCSSSAHARRVAVPSDPCSVAKRKALTYSRGLLAACSKDEDCSAFNVTGDKCDNPEMFRRDAHVADDKNLPQMKDEIRKACEDVWAKRPACPPENVKPACHEGKCVPVPNLPAAPANK